MNDDHLSTVRACLGDPLEQVLARSTFEFSVEKLHASDLITVTQAVRFEYARKSAGFVFPLATLVGLSLVNNRLTSVRLCGHIGGLTDEEAVAHAVTLAERIEKAGWHQVPGFGCGLTELAAKLADTATPPAVVLFLGTWMFGEDAFVLELQRSAVERIDGSESPVRSLVRSRLQNAEIVEEAYAQLPADHSTIIWRRPSHAQRS